MPKKGAGLTQQRLLMIGFYIEGASKKDAMLMAGYAEKTAHSAHTSVFNHPVVLAEIKRRQEDALEKCELDEEWVIRRLMRIADAGKVMAKFKIVRDDGHLDWNFTGATDAELSVINELSISYDKQGNHQMKIGVSDPKGALDSLCRKLGLFNDSITHKLEESLTDRISRGRERSRLAHGKIIDGEAEVLDVTPEAEVA